MTVSTLHPPWQSLQRTDKNEASWSKKALCSIYPYFKSVLGLMEDIFQILTSLSAQSLHRKSKVFPWGLEEMHHATFQVKQHDWKYELMPSFHEHVLIPYWVLCTKCSEITDEESITVYEEVQEAFMGEMIFTMSLERWVVHRQTRQGIPGRLIDTIQIPRCKKKWDQFKTQKSNMAVQRQQYNLKERTCDVNQILTIWHWAIHLLEKILFKKNVNMISIFKGCYKD